MRKPSILAPSVLVLLSLTPAVCQAGQQVKSKPSKEQSQASDGTESKRKPVKHKPHLCPEVIFVRDVYDRLMRYQSAAVDMAASESGTTPKPEEYMTFEIRNLWSGAIDKIFDQDVDAVDAIAGGEVIRLAPNHISEPAGPAHAYYGAQWTAAQEASGAIGDLTLREALLQNAPGSGHVETFASYEVTVRLGGMSRTYQAMALFTGEAEPLGRLKGQIFDNVIAGMNMVSTDQSPAAMAPWNEYVKSPRYRAVAAKIAQIKRSGKPLIPAKAPFGHLPGDDAESEPSGCSTAFSVNILNYSPQGGGGQIIGTSSGGSPTFTVFIGQQITLGNSNTAPDPSPTYAWIVGGSPVDSNGYHPENPPATTGGFPLNDLEEDEGALTFYWVAAGPGITVTLEVTDTAANGTQTTVSATAVFNVVAPSAVVVAQPGTMQIITIAPGVCKLQAGKSIPGSRGMTFTYGLSNDNGAPAAIANFNFAQVVQSTCANTTWTPGSSGCSSYTASGLDKGWPYGFNQNIPGGGGRSTDDAPNTPLAMSQTVIASAATMNYSFTMYLFYNPYPSAQGIWVPLVSVPWGFQSGTNLSANGSTSSVCTEMYSPPNPSAIPQPTPSNVTIGQGAPFVAPYSGLPQWSQVASTTAQTAPCPVGSCLTQKQ